MHNGRLNSYLTMHSQHETVKKCIPSLFMRRKWRKFTFYPYFFQKDKNYYISIIFFNLCHFPYFGVPKNTIFPILGFRKYIFPCFKSEKGTQITISFLFLYLRYFFAIIFVPEL